MRGCTICAIQAVRRFRGDDAELAASFERAKAEVVLHLGTVGGMGVLSGRKGVEVAHER
jgi:hypothetical protein